MADRRWWLRLNGAPPSSSASRARRSERRRRPLRVGEIRSSRRVLYVLALLFVAGVLRDVFGHTNLVDFCAPAASLLALVVVVAAAPATHRRQVLGLRPRLGE